MKLKRKAFYDPVTQSYLLPLSRGKFVTLDAEDVAWAEQWNWCLGNHGYANRGTSEGPRVACKRTAILLHVELAKRKGLVFEDADVCDHININKLDCRRSNLRIATRSNSCVNRKKFANNKSGITGVHWHKRIQKWQVSISADNHTRHLGYFETKAEAAAARARAVIELHGEYAPNSIEVH